jgi:ABC-2 type transport system permease protein
MIGGTFTIAKRELASYLRMPAGWIIIVLFLLLTGAVFALSALVPGRPATMRPFFEACGWLLLPLAPAVSMRLIAEEARTGSLETLLTSPLSTISLTLGKLFGACLFLIVMVLPTLALPAILWIVSEPAPDLGPILAGYLCLVLLGLLYLSIGLAASSATNNATLAFIATLFIILALLLAGTLGRQLPAPWQDLLFALALPPRLNDFAKGVIDTRHVVYFVSVSGLCWSVATSLVAWKRWRDR